VITGAAKVDILRRGDRIGQFLEDRTDTSCVYYGLTPDQLTQTSERKWQIWRVENVSGVVNTRFANRAKYDQVWDDRATLFPACVGTDPIWPEQPITGDVNAFFQGARTDATVEEISVSDAGWTLLTSLPNGQAVNIQNPDASGGDVKVNWISPSQPALPAGYVGMLLKENQERFYALSTGNVNIQIYAKAATGSRVLNVEQIG